MFLERPQLHIEKSMLEKLANIIGIASIVGMILYIALNWSALPDTVPIHFNAAGEVDSWGSKWLIFFLPTIAIALYLFMEAIEKRPHTHNYPARLTEQNAAQFYKESRQAMNLTKNIATSMLAYMGIRSVLVALGKVQGLGITVMGIFLLILGFVIIRSTIRMSKIQ
ncbi:MAG: DUF1648 domain-containing protein [Lysinibacillus sp.]